MNKLQQSIWLKEWKGKQKCHWRMSCQNSIIVLAISMVHQLKLVILPIQHAFNALTQQIFCLLPEWTVYTFQRVWTPFLTKWLVQWAWISHIFALFSWSSRTKWNGRRIKRIEHQRKSFSAFRHLSTPLLHLKCVQIDTVHRKGPGKVSSPFKKCTEPIWVMI